MTCAAPRNANLEIVARKKNWSVTTAGSKPFPMIMPEDADHAGALAFARSIWPLATIE